MMRAHLLGCLLGACLLAGPDTLRIEVQPLPAAARATLVGGQSGPHVFTYPGWYTWCPSVIRNAEGKYELFHSRWPKSKGWHSWLTHSEVCRAVSDRPEGPYQPLGMSLAAVSENRGKWFNAHNPKIERYEGSYWLYFIQTWVDGASEALRTEIAKLGGKHPLWMSAIRPNQRTFVAKAESLDGPWVITPEPIVQPAKTIVRLTVNPGVCRRPDGTYLMIVKGDKPGATQFIRNQAVATSPKPEGPWTIADKPAIDYLDTEDVSLWHDARRGRYYAVFHTGEGFIGLITSEDGLNWTKAAQYNLTPKLIRFDDGTSFKPTMMERPYVLRGDDGEPTHLLVGVGYAGGTSVVILPLKVSDAM